MRSSNDNSILQQSRQYHNNYYERLYDMLIGSSIDIETQLISSAISKSGKIEKQIEDIQSILNEHRLKTLQNSQAIIESIVTQGDAYQNYLNLKNIIEERSAKYSQIQLLNQMKNVLNNKIVQKINLLNSLGIEEEQRIQVLSDLEKLNDSLEKVEKSLSKLSSPWDGAMVGAGFSVLNDLNLQQSTQYETQRSYFYEESNNNKNNYNQNDYNSQDDKKQQGNTYSQRQENNNNEADDEIEESNIYADETESIHETTQQNLYATQDLKLNFTVGNHNNNQSYQSYQKPPKEDLHHSNLKLITPVAQKMHSIGYKTEPDSAMTPLLSADIVKTNIYKTPSDNNNKKLFKNNLNMMQQSNFDSHDNQRINSDERENNISDSFNPPPLQPQGSETVSAGDLISPQVTNTANNNDRHLREQDCTSFNKSEESSSQKFYLQFEASREKQNDNNILTFGANNAIQNNLRNENNSQNLFVNKSNSQEVQNQQEDDNSKKKLIDMFDACLSSLQQPDLIGLKKLSTKQEKVDKEIIEEEERQNDSIDEFVLNEKEIINHIYQDKIDNQNEQMKNQSNEEDTIKFHGVNISNVQEIEEYKGDNSFFSQREYYMTQTHCDTDKDIKKETLAKQQQKHDNKFVSTFGLNQSTEDPQAAYLEKKFGKDHFDIENFSYEKELEDKISALKKQLFSTNALGNMTANFSDESIFKNKSPADTIKPVITRKDELEALGEQDTSEIEQFKIVEESPDFKVQTQLNDQSLSNSSGKNKNDQEQEEENEVKAIRKPFEESNRFYNTLDDETLKEIQQQKYQKSEELQYNNQIGEEEEDQQEEEENENEEINHSNISLKNRNNESQQIPRSTLSENQFMQPFTQEIPNYADQYENLVNQFLNKPLSNQGIKSKNYEKQPPAFDQLNQYLDQQDKYHLENTFGANLQEISLNNSKIPSLLKQSSNQTEQLKDIEDNEEERPNQLLPKKELLHDSVRQQEYRKCRIFGASDFLKNSIKENEEIDKQQQEQNEEQNILDNKIISQNTTTLNKSKQISSKLNERYNNQKDNQNGQDEEEEEDDDDDFERDETPSFLDQYKNKNIKHKLYQNFMEESENANQQMNKIPQNSNKRNNQLSEEFVYIQQQKDQQEFLKTAHFQSSERQLNKKLNIQEQQPKQKPEELYEQDIEDEEEEELKEQTEQAQEELIDALKDDYPLLFQNASLKHLIQQQQKQSSSDLAKTTKLSKPSIKSASTTNQSQNLKSQKQSNNQIENKSNINSNTNKINSSSTAQKRIPPKKSTSNIPLPPQSSGLNRKSNNSLTQLPISQQSTQTEKENYKQLQNSELKNNKSEITDNNEQASLQRTLKNTKPKLSVAGEKPRIRSSSIRNEESDTPSSSQQQLKLSNNNQKYSQQQQIQQEEIEQAQKINQSSSSSKIKTNSISSSTVGKKLTNQNAILIKKNQEK